MASSKLVTLKTDLKSLKYGKDRKSGLINPIRDAFDVKLASEAFIKDWQEKSTWGLVLTSVAESFPSMISMIGSWRQHTSDGWKDRMKEISRNNPGNSLDV